MKLNKLLLTVIGSLAMSTAYAGDNYKAFMTFEGEYENIHGTGSDVKSLNLIPGVKYNNGVTLDLKTQIQSKEDTKSNSANIEPRVRYDYKIGMTDLTVWGRLGLGEKITNGDNFGYYTIEPGLTYALAKDASLFISDRYRDSFSDGKNYKTNTIYVGGSKKLTDVDVATLKLYRKYQDTESNGVEVAYTRWF